MEHESKTMNNDDNCSIFIITLTAIITFCLMCWLWGNPFSSIEKEKSLPCSTTQSKILQQQRDIKFLQDEIKKEQQ